MHEGSKIHTLSYMTKCAKNASSITTHKAAVTKDSKIPN